MVRAAGPAGCREIRVSFSRVAGRSLPGLCSKVGPMNRLALVTAALRALLRNKLRSSLTVLGITIGIAAVICVVAIGKAGQARVEQHLSNLGDNLVWIESGGRAVNGVRTGVRGTKTLTFADTVAIKAQIPLIKSVSPNVDASTQIVYANQNWFTTYRGVAPEYFEIKRWFVDQGASFPQDGVKLAGKHVGALLRERHRLRAEEPDDFNVRNPEDVIQAQLEASRTLTVLLIAIASISLLVGGIGIMNVMLVSVTERTREIGVRVAVGATEEAIQLQFLGESIMLSLVGGAAGVLVGIFGSYLVGQTLGWPIEMSLEAVVVAAMFSVAVGVFFGYYPARKASLLDPIEALRYE